MKDAVRCKRKVWWEREDPQEGLGEGHDGDGCVGNKIALSQKASGCPEVSAKGKGLSEKANWMGRRGSDE